MTDFDVLVIGGGPVGMSAGIQLASRGIRTFVAERHLTLSQHPKAAGIHPTTMELFAQWGVADAIRGQSLPPERSTGFAWTTRLKDGMDLGQVRFGGEPAPGPEPSPAQLCFTPQDIVEPILHEELLRHPAATFAFGTTAEVLYQDAGGVTVSLTGPTGRREVRASYVIAADGVRSPTRTRLGITETAGPVYGESINVYFASDALTRDTATWPFSLTWILNPDVTGAIYPVGRGNRWIFNFSGEEHEEYDEATCVRNVRHAAGDPALDIEVLSILRWRHEDAVADSWRTGRVFLAGDAAHRFPPHGGFGMNSGIQDTANLCWKLALVLDSAAADGLLDTYEQERKPIAEFNAEQCTLNTKKLAETGWLAEDPEILASIETPDGARLRERIRAAVPRQRDQFHSTGQQFGFRYASPAVVDDGSEPEPSTVADYRPSASPGSRAPHLWLRDHGGVRYSTVDLPAGRFVVLTGHAGGQWADAAEALDLPAWVIGADLVPETEPFEAAYGIATTGMVLIRPDGHVALRIPATADDCHAVLADALDRILRGAA